MPLVLLLVVLVLAGCGDSKKPSKTLLVAVDAPFSRSPYIGQTVARGVELAASEINVAGLAANNDTYSLKVKRYVQYREAYPPLVWAGLGLLLLPFAAAGMRITAEP